jgi:hypothetical protein
MKYLLWLIPFVAGLAAIRWPRLQSFALLLMLICGIVYLVMRIRQPPPPTPPLEGEQQRDWYSVQRDLPPRG